MKRALSLVAPLYVTVSVLAPPCAFAGWQIPPQLELRVPFHPTAFPSDGRTFLMYELYLTNFSGDTIDLRRIEVLDGDEAERKPLAAFEGEHMDALLTNAGSQSSNPRQVNAGATLVVFMQVVLDAEARLPKALKHRVITADSSLEGGLAQTHHTELKVLSPPVRGTGWHAYDGPSNDRENHHRRGLFVVDGRASISRRFATDWFLTNGDIYKWHRGDARDRHSYYSYGQPVFAVADGTIVTSRDGIPDNDPGPADDYTPAIALTVETAGGNFLVLDLGDGQFARYAHLQPGSLRVKTGDQVRSGDVLARIGVSGDPNVPHLHFEITQSSKPMVGEGLPYVIDQFRVKMPNGTWRTATRELPMRNMLVEFEPMSEHAN